MSKKIMWFGGIIVVLIILIALASYFPIIPYKHHYDSSSVRWIIAEACIGVEPGTSQYNDLDCGGKRKSSYEIELKTLSEWIKVKTEDSIRNKYGK